MSYQRTVDRHHPGCFIFLLDQSDSMNHPTADRPAISKAEALAEIVNTFLGTLIKRAIMERGEEPRHYYDIAVVGYGGKRIGSLLGGALAKCELVSPAQLKANELGRELRQGAMLPKWIEPFGWGGTPMCAAMNYAGQVAYGWIGAHQNSFPPIIINISDGVATDGTPDEVREWGQRLRSLGTNDGNLLLFNISISAASAAKADFPSDSSGLGDAASKLLFDISSELPQIMRDTAHGLGVGTMPGARGYMRNSHTQAIELALQVGTSIDRDAYQGLP